MYHYLAVILDLFIVCQSDKIPSYNYRNSYKMKSYSRAANQDQAHHLPSQLESCGWTKNICHARHGALNYSFDNFQTSVFNLASGRFCGRPFCTNLSGSRVPHSRVPVCSCWGGFFLVGLFFSFRSRGLEWGRAAEMVMVGARRAADAGDQRHGLARDPWSAASRRRVAPAGGRHANLQLREVGERTVWRGGRRSSPAGLAISKHPSRVGRKDCCLTDSGLRAA